MDGLKELTKAVLSLTSCQHSDMIDADKFSSHFKQLSARIYGAQLQDRDTFCGLHAIFNSVVSCFRKWVPHDDMK